MDTCSMKSRQIKMNKSERQDQNYYCIVRTAPNASAGCQDSLQTRLNNSNYSCNNNNNNNMRMSAITITCLAALCITTIGSVDAFNSGSSGGGSVLSRSLVNGATRIANFKSGAAGVKSAVTSSSQLENHHYHSQIIGANTARRSSTILHQSNNNHKYNNNNDEKESTNDHDTSSLELIQKWLLLHLPSLSSEDLQLYSSTLLQDGFDSVDKLQQVNNNNNNSNINSGGGGRANTRLEDLYFMKKGHRRVLLQKIGKVREMKGNVKNRLRLFEEESLIDESGVDDEEELETGQDDENVPSDGDKYLPKIGTRSPTTKSSLDNSNDDDDDETLISLTAWEDKQLEEFVYSDQERDVMDDKSRRRLKEIDAYLREHWNKPSSRSSSGSNEEEGGGDDYDTTTFEQKELGEFVYNEQTRGAMDDKSKRRLKEIEQFLVEKWQSGDEGEEELEEYDTTTFETKELEEFVYNEQTRGAMDDKSKRRLKEIEAYIMEQRRLQREREEEELNAAEEEEEEESLSSPSHPSSWNFADLEDFMYNEQEREVMDDKGKRRLKEIEDYVRSERNRLRDSSNGYSEEEEELLDDFAARYQGITTARDEKKSGGTVVSSSVAKEEKRLEEFREAWLARQRNGGSSPSAMDEDDMMDDFASRYQKLGKATADGVSGGSSEKSTRRLKDLDAFLRARQSRQSKSMSNEEDTPMDDFQSRYQKIGGSAADSGASGRSDDKSSRRLRALDAFLKSRQSREVAAAEEEALRLELLQKPVKELNATERKERLRVEEFQRRARNAKEKKKRPAKKGNDGAVAAAVAKRKSNEERRLEELNRWTAKQNELAEKRRMVKLLEEYESLKKNASKKVKKKKKKEQISKPQATAKDDKSQSSPITPPNDGAIINDFFEQKRVHSMSTTLPPSNDVRTLQQKAENSPRPDDEECIDDECFDITRNSFAERDSKSLATTLQPSNKNAKVDTYVAGSKEKVSDFLPPRSDRSNDQNLVSKESIDIGRESYSTRESKSLSTTLPPSNKNAKQNSYVPGSSSEDCEGDECVDITRSSFPERDVRSLSTTLPPSNKNARQNTYVPGSSSEDDEDCVGEECVDITRNSFSERGVRSLSTTMPPSNKNAKQNSYVPGSKSDEEDCVGEECFDISRESFPERETKSLSTTLPPSSKNAKKNTYVAGSSKGDDEECEGDECVDITRTSFPEREVRSLSTTLPPSNNNAKQNSYVPESNTKKSEGDVEPDEYFDITTRLFQERGQSLSSGNQSVFREDERSEMNSRASSLYAKFQSKKSPPSGSSAPPTRPVRRMAKAAEQSDMEGAYMDITQRLWDERKSSSHSTPPASSFKEEEKKEMNDRARPSPRGIPPPTGSFSSLSQFVKTGTVRRPNGSESYVDASERFTDRSSFVQSVNSGTAKRGTTSGSYRDSSRSGSASAGDHVDESERFSDRSSFVQSVNSGTNRKGMTSGSYKDRGSSGDERDEFIDESERFSERSSFVQSVNTGTAKKGTTSGSYVESKDRVRPGSSSSIDDDGYQDITKNPFSRDRSSFVLRVNSGTSKLGTTSGSFRESKGKSEPEEKKYFSSDRSTLMGARTWKNEDVSINNEHEKYLSSDRSSIVGPPYLRDAGKASDEHKKYISSDRSSIVGAPSLRRAGSSDEHEKYLSSDRSSLSGAPSIRRREVSNEYLDTNQFSSNLSPSSPVKASATNKVWRTTSQVGGEESSIDTPPAFMKNLDMLAGGRKTIKKRRGPDEYLNQNSFSQTLAPSTVTQSATVASRNNNPYLNKNGFNDINSMRTSNASGAQFKSSHDVSPEEKERLDNLDTKWARLPDFDEMAGKSAVDANAAGSRSPKRQLEDKDEEYTMVGDFSRLERATSFVRDSNTAAKSGLSDLSEIEPSDQLEEEATATTGEEDAEFEVMNWLLKNLPQLDEEDAVNYFVSLLEDGFDSIDMLKEVLEEDLYFMKEEHQIQLMENIAMGEDEALSGAFVDDGKSSSESDKSATIELDEASSRLDEVKDVQRSDNATELTEQEIEDAQEKKQAFQHEDEYEYTDITRANFGEHVSLSSATPSLFEKDTPADDDEGPFSWQLDVRKGVANGDDMDGGAESYKDQSAESNQLFQATPPVEVELNDSDNVQDSVPVKKQRRSVEPRRVDSDSQPLFQATPPLTVELKEGMTAEEAASVREERLSGESPKIDPPQPSEIMEGMTAEEAESARSTRLIASGQSTTTSTVETPKPKTTRKDEVALPPRSALHQYYIAQGFTTDQAQKLKDYYTIWTIGPSHEMKFTSVFTCPITGEHFACGIMDGGEVWGGNVWYKNKKQAMNAAAAKAVDCFAFRKNSSGPHVRYCEDDPYIEDEAPSLSLPPDVVLPTERIRPNNT